MDVICWPADRLGEALEALARASGLLKPNQRTPSPACSADSAESQLDEWFARAGKSLGLECVAVESTYADIEAMVRNSSPAVLEITTGCDPVYLAVVHRRGGSLRVLTPAMNCARVSVDAVCRMLRQPLQAGLATDVDRLLENAGLEGRGKAPAAAAILREYLGGVPIRGCWMLRIPPTAPLKEQVTQHGLATRLVWFVTAHVLDVALLLTAWWTIGKALLEGRLDFGWLLAWGLLLITRIPLQLSATWTQGVIATRAGAILKRRLLAGSVYLDPEEMRHRGIGQLLGQVIESEALESLAAGGTMTGAVAVVEILFAIAVLGFGAQNVWLALLLAAWTALLLFLSWRYMQSLQSWTEDRIDITSDLVERMAGHRTRLAQEAPERWHDTEDERVESYFAGCRAMDRRLARLLAIIPRGWMILSLLILVRPFLRAEASPQTLAIAVGGILLALGALKKLTNSVTNLGSALIAWKQAKPQLDAAERAYLESTPDLVLPRPRSGAGDTMLQALDVRFAHQGRVHHVLNGANLRIAQGDRILIEGPSGGGKSTLAALLSGLREPQSGLILMQGLDLQTLGSDEWRRRIAVAPQFHENHVLTGSLAFNLLMGRRWPPRPEDIAEAEAVCREVGLDELLDRMPGGIFQQVGESGWQLSLGERSRVFLARALLQDSSIVILDESFGALDPNSMSRAVDCANRRAETLLVIAHR